MDYCVFCKIVKGELPCSKVYEDNLLLAFMDIQPVEKGHILIIPKEHHKYMSEVSDELLREIIILAKKIEIALRKSEVKAQDINLFLADGEIANQEIPHFHLHIIPRYPNDGFGFKFREDYQTRPLREELDSLASVVKKYLK